MARTSPVREERTRPRQTPLLFLYPKPYTKAITKQTTMTKEQTERELKKVKEQDRRAWVSTYRQKNPAQRAKMIATGAFSTKATQSNEQQRLQKEYSRINRANLAKTLTPKWLEKDRKKK